jgi:hypothetical protein
VTEEDRLVNEVRGAAGEEARPDQRGSANVELPPELSIVDAEAVASALTLTEGEIDELRDPFTERQVDVHRNVVGRTYVSRTQPGDQQELFD